MTEHESGEVLRPPQKSSQQLVKELVERFAVDLVDNNEDHVQHLSSYQLPTDCLGMIAIGQPNVGFEKFIEHSNPEDVYYSIYVGSDVGDTILSINMDNDLLAGGYGENGLESSKRLSPDDIQPLLTKLAALLWLHERGLDNPKLTEKTIVKTVVTAVKELATTPAYAYDQDGDKLNYYPLLTSDAIWTNLKAEITVSEDTALYRLALVDDDHEIVDLCVEGNTNELLVTNYSGTEFEGDEGLRRTRIVFATLAEVITSNQIVES